MYIFWSVHNLKNYKLHEMVVSYSDILFSRFLWKIDRITFLVHFLFFTQVLYEQQLDFDWEDLLCLLWLPIVLKRLARPMPRRSSSLTFSCPLSSFRVQFVGADYCLDKLQFFRDIVVGSKPLRVVAFRHQHQHCREVFVNMVTWKCSFVMRIRLPIYFTLRLVDKIVYIYPYTVTLNDCITSLLVKLLINS